ncbi:MAG: energy transducer TonB family protein [Bacteriovoracaceae bacterium]
MTDQLKKWTTNFWTFLGFIVFLHLVMLVMKSIESSPRTRVVSESTLIKVKLLQEHFQKPEQQEKKKQIVQSEEAPSERTPVDSKFLSDKDRAFDRQTVARKVDTFQTATQGHSAQVGEQTHKAAKKQGKKNIDLSKIGYNALGEENPFKEVTQTAKIGQKTTPKKATVSASNDYIQDIALGDFTQVNTTEFKFYGFYHRIRQKLEQFWGRSIQEKAAALHRSGRRLPASEDLITSLKITLDEQGQIVRVKVLSTSGVRELDEAAVESFNKAGPFPNPPKDLLVEGEATIEWGFVVKS